MNNSDLRPMYACVMFSRLILAILLISSHAGMLLAAMPSVAAVGSPSYSTDSCCPLCVPVEDGQIQIGCGCGCGEVENDDRLPDAPHETASTINRDIAVPAPLRESSVLVPWAMADAVALAGVNDDVAGHSNTMRFLARVGHWLN